MNIANISIIEHNNRFLFKNKVEYIQARFRQVNKITKKLVALFFKNFNSTFI